MCGRSSARFTEIQTEEMLDVELFSEAIEEKARPLKHLPLFNIAPTMSIPVVLAEAPEIAQMAQWGFVEKFRYKRKEGYHDKVLFNARGETVADKWPNHMHFNKGRRCLILLDGFFEWMHGEKDKIPMYISHREDAVFAVGGVYKVQEIEGENRLVCNLITTKANTLLQAVHNGGGNKHRMPYLLSSKDEMERWLDPKLEGRQAQKLIKPYPEGQLTAKPVSKALNASYANDPELLETAFYDDPYLERLNEDFDLDLAD